jgi:hypothetical protein
MMFDLPNESCAVQREEVPDKAYSTGTGYFTPSVPVFFVTTIETVMHESHSILLDSTNSLNLTKPVNGINI